MVFLARFILKRPGQAALVAAAMAIMGIILVPAIWLSGAAVALVTLVKDCRQGFMVMVLATVGSVVFATVIFSSPMVVVYFVLMAWLPAWMAATVLKQTASLATSLQLMTVLSLTAIIVLYFVFPDFGELWRPTLELFVQQLSDQSQGQLDSQALLRASEVVIRLMPGLVATSLLFGSMISLSLARWWQAALYNPGGFGSEFQSLKLGKLVAIVAVGIILASIVLGTDVLNSMLMVLSMLYLTQGMSILHAIVNRKKMNVAWLYLVYILMFFVPEVMVLMVLVGITDAWIDFRRRLIAV
jgi:hypothetical protein